MPDQKNPAHNKDKQLFLRITAEAISRGIVTPKVRVGLKSLWWYHCWLNKIANMFFPASEQNAFLIDYWTTIGFDIGACENADFTEWRTLLHELQHVRQQMKWTRLLWLWLYGFPVSLALVFLAAIPLICVFAHGWLLGGLTTLAVTLAAACFIPQLPDPFRKRQELEAYTINMFFEHRKTGDISPVYIAWLVTTFHSMAYYIMDNNADKLKIELSNIAKEIIAGTHPVKDNPLVKLALELQQNVTAKGIGDGSHKS